MSLIWTFTLFLSIAPVQSVELFRPSFLPVKSGEHVTIHCPFGDIRKTDSVVWYKQAFGEMPQKVGERLIYKDVEVRPEFRSSGFKLTVTDNGKGTSLTIQHVRKEHGGLYYCAKCMLESVELSNGTYLAIAGDEDLKVSVFQSSLQDSVPAGASVTLQCSVLSESRAEELRVFWFRAAPPQSDPQIIYTHHDSSHQCERVTSTHTCVYNFSKNILSLNDTGTYYCAVALCGKIVLGNGTLVQTESGSLSSEVIYLTVVTVVCLVVIFAQAFIIWKMWKSKQSRVRLQKDSVAEEALSQDDDAVELKYAALHFNKKKSKRETRKRDKPDSCIYSAVAYST